MSLTYQEIKKINMRRIQRSKSETPAQPDGSETYAWKET